MLKRTGFLLALLLLFISVPLIIAGTSRHDQSVVRPSSTAIPPAPTAPNASDVVCPPLAAPQIAVSYEETYSAKGGKFDRYRFTIANVSVYSDDLFTAAPDLPACGLNTKSSRTWVDIYDASEHRIYGFCALGEAASLNQIWFAVPVNAAPPSEVYIMLKDRRCNSSVASNRVAVQPRQ